MKYVALMLVMAAALFGGTIAAAMRLSEWTPAQSAESIPGTSGSLNTAALEGCAFVAQRDDVLYFASNRAGGIGGLDIWYSARTADGTWSAPVNFAAVNSTADDLCPSATRNGRDFLFVSARAGGCGGLDLYASRRHETRGWSAPRNLGCGINSAADEASPYLLEDELYFSSTRPGGFTPDPADAVSGDGDIYVSALDGESFQAPALVPGLNSAVNDLRPNVRRDGLEIFLDSNRSGGIGGLDLWVATRGSTSEAWSAPVNLGDGLNSSANDLRASLSWDGKTLYFGSNRVGGEGSQDIYFTTRGKVTSPD